MSRGREIDWAAIAATFVLGSTVGFAILALGNSKAWWAWTAIPVEAFLVGLSLQLISPTGAPKRWFKDE